LKFIYTYNSYLIVLALICFSFASLRGAHLVGGEMSYRCLGGNSYEITLKVYRDCQSSATQFDGQAKVGIFNHSTGALIRTLNVRFPGESNIPINTISSCLVVPPGLCLKQTIYKDTTTLLPSTSGYDIVYQRCCRDPAIVNIIGPGAGNTYYSFIPANDIACNSSPSFNNFPPVFLCINDSINFDYSATDLDGDSLVYEFVTPYTGGTSVNPAPNPSPPPFSTVNWAPGYTISNQITATPLLAINSVTGQLTGIPTGIGKYVVGVKVKEYRNGVFISETIRDFQFNILNCQKSIAAIFDPGTICNSFEVTFTNQSINATSYFWNFGDPTTLADTSLAVSPSYTYPDTGVYRVMLIVDPVNPVCADTSFLNVRLYPKPKAELEIDNEVVPTYAPTISFENKTKDVVTSVFTDGEGGIYSPFTTATTTYKNEGYYYPTLIIENVFGCFDTLTVQVYVRPEIYVPNSFTPNDDGKNEVFLPSVASFIDYEFMIFNRWGELIFQTRDPKLGWDGKGPNGKVLKQEVYVYRIIYKDPSGLSKELFGNVNLLR
jgi:gliding motility-associated-like protein